MLSRLVGVGDLLMPEQALKVGFHVEKCRQRFQIAVPAVGHQLGQHAERLGWGSAHFDDGGVRRQTDEAKLRERARGPVRRGSSIEPGHHASVKLVIRPGQCQQGVDVKQQ